MARSRDISKVLSSNTTLATDAEVAASYAPIAAGGLVQIVPVSVSNTGGTTSISTNGVVTFSGASVVSLNNCFTSTYENYKIIMNVYGTVDGDLFFRVRSSGSDLTSSYYNTYRYARTDGVTGGSGNANASRFEYIMRPRNSSSQKGMTTFDIVSPQTADTTKLVGQFVYWETSTIVTSFAFSGMVNNTNSYDGITFYPSAGNVTGTITVYGYRN